ETNRSPFDFAEGEIDFN
ncbi:unnamed protein product, partial [Didymodactylos carnosus]